jgi:hypothetical protein
LAVSLMAPLTLLAAPFTCSRSMGNSFGMIRSGITRETGLRFLRQNAPVVLQSRRRPIRE